MSLDHNDEKTGKGRVGGGGGGVTEKGGQRERGRCRDVSLSFSGR